MTGSVTFVPREKYDRIDRVNWSTLKHMGRSPAHYRAALMSRGEDSDARRRGRAAHLAVFEPERFRTSVVMWDGGARRGKAWDAFEAEHKGLEILTEDAYQSVAQMAEAARRDPVAGRYVSGGKGEQTIQWTHVSQDLGALPGYFIDCKGRVDFIADADGGALVDLKTTRDASPDGFGREVWRYRYDAQAAFYVDGYHAATGRLLPAVLIAVEAAEPWVVQVYRMPDHVLETGRQHYRALLDRLAVCRAESKWPGYSDAEQELTLPRWADPNPEDENIESVGLTF